MDHTSTSLLWRASKGVEPAWQSLSDLYRPLIASWLVRCGLDRQDVDDVAQDVLTKLVTELPRFQHSGAIGAFRGWLRTVTVNSARLHWRKSRRQPKGTGDTEAHVFLNELAADNSGLSQQWGREHDHHVLLSLLERMESEFDPATIRVFRRLTFDGANAADVAKELNMSPGAVYVAKSRVLRRLREEAAGLVDDAAEFA